MVNAIPFARVEFTGSGKTFAAFAVCPKCGERIPLKVRKDFESFTKEEYAQHYVQTHEEKAAQVQ